MTDYGEYRSSETGRYRNPNQQIACHQQDAKHDASNGGPFLGPAALYGSMTPFHPFFLSGSRSDLHRAIPSLVTTTRISDCVPNCYQWSTHVLVLLFLLAW